MSTGRSTFISCFKIHSNSSSLERKLGGSRFLKSVSMIEGIKSDQGKGGVDVVEEQFCSVGAESGFPQELFERDVGVKGIEETEPKGEFVRGEEKVGTFSDEVGTTFVESNPWATGRRRDEEGKEDEMEDSEGDSEKVDRVGDVMGVEVKGGERGRNSFSGNKEGDRKGRKLLDERDEIWGEEEGEL